MDTFGTPIPVSIRESFPTILFARFANEFTSVIQSLACCNLLFERLTLLVELDVKTEDYTVCKVLHGMSWLSFRSDVVMQVGKSYSSAREALILNGNFVIKQLKECDARQGTSLIDSALVIDLQKEVRVFNIKIQYALL